jgi:hypothetical protein
VLLNLEKETSFGGKICILKNDILNGPKHIFCCHDPCPAYFCNGPKTDEENYIEVEKSYVSSEFQEFIINVNEGKSSDIFDEVSDMELF